MNPTITFLVSVISLQSDGTWELEKHALSFDANRPSFDMEDSVKYYREDKVKNFWGSLMPPMRNFDICAIEQITSVVIHDQAA